MTDEEKKPEEQPKPGEAEESAPIEVAADNEDDKLEHEVNHSDELTVDVEVHKVTGSQKRLWFMVVAGAGLLSAGGIFLYTTLEANPSGNSSSFTQAVTNSEEPEKEAASNHVFAYQPGTGSYRTKNLSNSAAEDVAVASSFTDVDQSSNFQISSSGGVVAVRNSQGSIQTKAGEVEQTFQISSLSSWVLNFDGTRIYALSGVDLVEYDTFSGEGGVVSAGFALSGNDVSPIYYSRDGSIRQFSKAGTELTEVTYHQSDSEPPVPRVITLTRLERVDSFTPNSMSPDGTSLVFTSSYEGRQTLQLISLNSFVMRTVYLADIPGGRPESFAWSLDSNNLAINTVGSSVARLENLKIGTLEKLVVLEQEVAGSRFNATSWSPDKQQISYVQDSVLKVVNLDTNEIIDGLSGVEEDAITGWYQN